MKAIFSCVAASLAAVLLYSSEARAVELVIRNNINPVEDGAVIEIEEAESEEAPKNRVAFKVLPGEQKAITSGNVTTFMMSIVYPRHKIKYQVKCPRSTKGNGQITPVQVHNDELPHGCKVVRRGHWSKSTGMSWRAEGI